MSYEAERAAIEGYFGPLWNNRTPAGYDGRSFTPTDRSIQIDILNAQAMQMSVGAPGQNVARYVGVVAIRVFTKLGDSTHFSRQIEDDVSDIFRNADIGSIRFGIPYTSGNEVTGAWRVRTVMCPFTRDEFHA